MGDMELLLNPELNSVIGGRGAGKSTFLKYLAFGVARSCFDLTEKKVSGSERLRKLLEDTLLKRNGEIEIYFVQDGAEFRVSRTFAGGYRPELKYPGDAVDQLSPLELRALIPAAVYCQGELSEFGRTEDPRDALRQIVHLVEPAFQRQAEERDAELEAAKSDLVRVVNSLLRLWRVQAERNRHEMRSKAQAARIEALEKTLPSVAAEDDEELKRSSLYEEADRYVSNVVDLFNRMPSDLETLHQHSQDIDQVLIPDIHPTLNALRLHLKDIVSRLEHALCTVRGEVNAAISRVKRDVEGWNAALSEQRRKRDTILQKIGVQRTVRRQIASLQAEANHDQSKILELDREIKQRSGISDRIKEARSNMHNVVHAHVDDVKRWARKIHDASEGTISALIDEQGDSSEILEALTNITAGTRSQEQARARGFRELVQEDGGAWDVLSRLPNEAMQLMRWKIVGNNKEEPAPNTPGLERVVGTGGEIMQNFIGALDEGRIATLLNASPRPAIKLKFVAEQGEIEFEKASEGQRAAALLMLLLNQEGGPLIIDEPEGDLDNTIVTKIVDVLHKVKPKRQIIFATHNANLVVNGATEYLISLGSHSDGTRGVREYGAIDVPAVRKNITEVMEGGEKAFRDRQRKYGF